MAVQVPNTGPYNVDQRKYGNGTDSSIGPQIRTDFFKKKALIEVVKDSVFSPLADAEAMPKNFGKTIKQFHYLPLLDDRNINDQGIDASGAAVNQGVTIHIGWGGAGKFTHKPGQMHGQTVKGEGTTGAAALTDAKAKALSVLISMGFDGVDIDYATAKADAEAAGFFVDESAAYPVTGNLYGSSKDVGTISAKLPVLSEHGGRVNRVGFRRIEIEGSIEKFGFFDEYTQESRDFDTDEELEMHVHREMLRGANEITEDMIQMDLLNGAGVVMFAGDATADGEMSPEGGGEVDEVTYDDFVKLGIEMFNNRTPKQTTMIAGSRMIDTRVVDGGWVMFVGSELIPTLRRLTDYFGDKALIEAKHYAAGTTLLKGEIGSIDHFRIVVAQEMQHWAGAGDTVAANPGYRETSGKYDVYPMLVVGQGSFTTIGFQTDGKGVKFKIQHAKPGKGDKHDPFGETGFMSIKWYYGSMILRPERLALIKTLARW